MYTFGVLSRNCGAYTNAESTSAIAEACRTADATSAEGPRRGSGCTVNRLIVRDDLIRRVIPSPVGWPARTSHGEQVVLLVECSPYGAPNSRASELHPGKVTAVKSRDPRLHGKRVSKYARGSLALQGHLGNEHHFGQVEVVVALAGEHRRFFVRTSNALVLLTGHARHEEIR